MEGQQPAAKNLVSPAFHCGIPLSGLDVLRDGLLAELAAISDFLKYGEDALVIDWFVGCRSDRGCFRFVIDFDCQHTRCCFQGRDGLACSARAGHALDGKSRAIHFGRELTSVWCQHRGDDLREEQKHHRHRRDAPEHDLVHGHHVESPTSAADCRGAAIFLGNLASPGAIGEVEGCAEKAEGDNHHHPAVFLDSCQHARAGDAEHD